MPAVPDRSAMLRGASFAPNRRKIPGIALMALRRIYNPRNRTCGCSPECWCQRTTLGRMFRWWFPGRLFGMPHEGRSGLERRNLEAR